jgi:hypothetical protein
MKSPVQLEKIGGPEDRVGKDKGMIVPRSESNGIEITGILMDILGITVGRANGTARLVARPSVGVTPLVQLRLMTSPAAS